MPSLKDIRSRIASTKNTQSITRAMKMVSAAKLRRAQMNIVNLRPYAHKLLAVTANIATTNRISHPLLEKKENPQKILVVVLTSDRGLCGGFNGSILRFANDYYQKNKTNVAKMDFILIGRKASDFFRARHIKPKETILNLAREISYTLASRVADQLIQAYVEGEYDAIRLIYNEFKSALQQNVVCETLLPVDLSKASFATSQAGDKASFAKDYIFEPEPEKIIESLLRKHFSVQVYRCMSESIAAEHGARMTAMENATKNAGEMIQGLTLTYNKIRQASITKELIEITSGAEALK